MSDTEDVTGRSSRSRSRSGTYTSRSRSRSGSRSRSPSRTPTHSYTGSRSRSRSRSHSGSRSRSRSRSRSGSGSPRSRSRSPSHSRTASRTPTRTPSQTARSDVEGDTARTASHASRDGEVSQRLVGEETAEAAPASTTSESVIAPANTTRGPNDTSSLELGIKGVADLLRDKKVAGLQAPPPEQDGQGEDADKPDDTGDDNGADEADDQSAGNDVDESKHDRPPNGDTAQENASGPDKQPQDDDDADADKKSEAEEEMKRSETLDSEHKAWLLSQPAAHDAAVTIQSLFRGRSTRQMLSEDEALPQSIRRRVQPRRMSTVVESKRTEAIGKGMDLVTLSPEEVEDIQSAFEIFDTDGSNSIEGNELQLFVRALGQNPSKLELFHMQQEMDEDGDGTVSAEEFLHFFRKRMTIFGSADLVQELFSIFDINRNGLIHASEMVEVMEHFNVHLTDEEAEQMIRELDLDSDGAISLDEFEQVALDF